MAKRIASCPSCKSSRVQEVIMGLPPQALMDDPNYFIGGCVVYGDELRYRCADCEERWN